MALVFSPLGIILKVVWFVPLVELESPSLSLSLFPSSSLSPFLPVLLPLSLCPSLSVLFPLYLPFICPSSSVSPLSLCLYPSPSLSASLCNSSSLASSLSLSVLLSLSPSLSVLSPSLSLFCSRSLSLPFSVLLRFSPSLSILCHPPSLFLSPNPYSSFSRTPPRSFSPSLPPLSPFLSVSLTLYRSLFLFLSLLQTGPISNLCRFPHHTQQCIS